MYKEKLKKYIEQDINKPIYLFHGSPKKLDILKPMLSHDSRGNKNNIAHAIFLFPSIIKASAYAFKDTIKQNSQNLDYDFYIPSNDKEPVMIMKNVNVDDNIVGYIYVFKNDNYMIKDDNSLQYKCYKELIPDDIIEIYFNDFKQFYEINNDIKKVGKK